MTPELITPDALEVLPADFVLSDGQLLPLIDLLIWDYERGSTTALNKEGPPTPCFQGKRRRAKEKI